ncbi:sensor histidine kinase [Paucibacter sp. DJ2R-2]|uniref:sensor histidine kinase n=1 Tax=Paucibacter sp. DJ2R-2 TaxID=2893558 RepID=UPI0021E475D3|nr:histidine kinase [Paucibacter sp. DJ2R-2]MCV2419558.1 histidine kinase [Paucibacter sp. DJ4R-1]MCV2437539.1 histidine kinase [Paucibacter sp. DJ2R-2]
MPHLPSSKDHPTHLVLDWTQWVWPGPRRVFSEDELARAGQQPWPVSIDYYVLSNVLVLLAINYREMSRHWVLLICIAAMALTLGVLGLARILWRHPSRRRLNLISYGMAFSVALVVALLGRPLLAEQAAQYGRVVKFFAVFGLSVFLVVYTSFLFLTVIRVQQIEARLRELDEQAHALKLARRLATAQMQPHFLFNTLASVQHWVDTQDPRAGGTLRAFTQYLRATLPMFERESLNLAEELQIVRSYLEVMQARLGERLRWELEIEPGLEAVTVPPGLLLTLAENAIGHGIEPALRGGRVVVRAWRQDQQVVLEVEDDGMGLSSAEPVERLGLSNSRDRLRQLHGDQASLRLLPRAPGALAQVQIPWPAAGASA